MCLQAPVIPTIRITHSPMRGPLNHPGSLEVTVAASQWCGVRSPSLLLSTFYVPDTKMPRGAALQSSGGRDINETVVQ